LSDRGDECYVPLAICVKVVGITKVPHLSKFAAPDRRRISSQ